MAKLTALVALFGILFIVADASIHRTTITTTEIDEENPRTSESCREQIRGMDLDHCEEFMKECQYGGCRGSSSQHLEPCCRQLKNIATPSCRCDAIEEMMQQGTFRRQQSQEMLEAARNLPTYCNIPPMHCDIRMLSSWY